MNDKIARNFLIAAIIAFVGPNGLYLHALFTNPTSNLEALNNPVALAFMIEAVILLILFIYYVFERTKSIKQVFLYLVLSFIGSLAFSLPLFIYLQHRRQDEK